MKSIRKIRKFYILVDKQNKEVKMEIQIVNIEKIKPNPLQPRVRFDKEKIEELSQSIKELSILQPISVRHIGTHYQIISGERRWRAAKLAGLEKVPVIIKDIDDCQLLIESLVENLQREDLDDFEKAKALKQIMTENGFKTQSELARKLGVSSTFVSQYLSIVPLEKEIKSYNNTVPTRVLKSIARLPQKTIRKEIIKNVLNGTLRSINVEKIVSIIKNKNTSKIIKKALIKNDLDLDIALELEKIDDERVHYRVIKKLIEQKKHKEDIVKKAKFAQMRSDKMLDKFLVLRELEKEGLILSTLWDIGPRKNYAGDSSFHGNSPTQIVEQCILRLSKKNDLVVDPMAGSGTTLDVCKLLDRKCIGYDLNSSGRDDIIKNNSERIPLNDNSVDMIFLHPPYWNLIRYSKMKEDVSNCGLEDFYKRMNNVINECYRILKPNKFFCILIGDLIKKGRFIPISRKIADMIEYIGFKDCGYSIKITSGSQSQVVKGKILYAELAYTNNLKINHDSVMFWQK